MSAELRLAALNSDDVCSPPRKAVRQKLLWHASCIKQHGRKLCYEAAWIDRIFMQRKQKCSGWLKSEL